MPSVARQYVLNLALVGIVTGLNADAVADHRRALPLTGDGRSHEAIAEEPGDATFSQIDRISIVRPRASEDRDETSHRLRATASAVTRGGLIRVGIDLPPGGRSV